MQKFTYLCIKFYNRSGVLDEITYDIKGKNLDLFFEILNVWFNDNKVELENVELVR